MGNRSFLEKIGSDGRTSSGVKVEKIISIRAALACKGDAHSVRSSGGGRCRGEERCVSALVCTKSEAKSLDVCVLPNVTRKIKF